MKFRVELRLLIDGLTSPGVLIFLGAALLAC